MAERFSVVIPNWEWEALSWRPALRRCAVRRWRALEVILVDNASSDGSQEYVPRQPPGSASH